MCGIVGVVSNAPVNQLIYDALLLLQHRGQDAAGIATQMGTKFFMHKAKGMVRDVFRTRNMRALPGNSGIGHVRYPTAGSASDSEEAQPFYVNAPFGISFAHNGNLEGYRPKLHAAFHPVGETDSERAFCWLMQELAKNHARLPSVEHLTETLTELAQSVLPGYVANTLLLSALAAVVAFVQLAIEQMFVPRLRAGVELHLPLRKFQLALVLGLPAYLGFLMALGIGAGHASFAAICLQYVVLAMQMGFLETKVRWVLGEGHSATVQRTLGGLIWLALGWLLGVNLLSEVWHEAPVLRVGLVAVGALVIRWLSIRAMKHDLATL